MNKITSTLFLVLLFAGATDAAVISRDWKTPGDGLLTYDTVNKREWLDLSQTLLFQFPSSGSLESRFQSVIAQTSAGGIFEGFIPAKLADVIALAESAEIDTGTTDFVSNEIPTLNFTSLIGVTSGTNSVLGFLDEFDPAPPNPSTPRLIASFGASSSENFAGLFVFSNVSGFDAPGISRFAGVWLYRVVPEPCCFHAALVVLPFLVTARSRRL